MLDYSDCYKELLVQAMNDDALPAAAAQSSRA
jgi:hypothetical protein